MAPRARARRLQAALLLLLVLVLTGGALLHWPYQGYPPPASVFIERGMSRRAIAERLEAAGVLASRWPFLGYAALNSRRTLKAGEYLFERSLSPVEVFDKLVRGEVRLYALVIPEGLTRWDIADRVAAAGLAPRDEFLQATENAALIRDLAPGAENLEGYLFPDTYFFAKPSHPDVIVQTMVRQFRRVYGRLAEGDSDPRALTPHQLVTLASLVEKETAVAEERGLVAAVFHNRLRKKLILACDPTVIYAERLAKGGSWDGRINVSDLQRNSPYNTYRHAGLPPGPIASPGRAALAAALHPPASKYLYFVSDTQGGHFFAATSGEHSRNVARFRRLRAQQLEDLRRQAAPKRAASPGS